MESKSQSPSVAHQKRVRDKWKAQPTPPVDLSLKRALVRPVSYATAKRVILKYEWLGSMAATQEHYGIMWDGYCGGVTCFGKNNLNGTAIFKRYGLSRDEIITLSRGACVHWAPRGANSKLIAHSLRDLRRRKVAKLVVAFSDTRAGEVGTVYQATGWTYVGRAAAAQQWRSPRGRTENVDYPFQLAKRSGTTASQTKRLLKFGWRKVEGHPKHRYVFVLDRADKRLMALVESMREPYPKRAK